MRSHLSALLSFCGSSSWPECSHLRSSLSSSLRKTISASSKFPTKRNRPFIFRTLSASGLAHAAQSITSTSAESAEDSARSSAPGHAPTAGLSQLIISAVNVDAPSPLIRAWVLVRSQVRASCLMARLMDSLMVSLMHNPMAARLITSLIIPSSRTILIFK